MTVVSRCRVQVLPDPGKLISAVLLIRSGDKRPAPGGVHGSDDSQTLRMGGGGLTNTKECM